MSFYNAWTNGYIPVQPRDYLKFVRIPAIGALYAAKHQAWQDHLDAKAEYKIANEIVCAGRYNADALIRWRDAELRWNETVRIYNEACQALDEAYDEALNALEK